MFLTPIFNFTRSASVNQSCQRNGARKQRRRRLHQNSLCVYVCASTGPVGSKFLCWTTFERQFDVNNCHSRSLNEDQTVCLLAYFLLLQCHCLDLNRWIAGLLHPFFFVGLFQMRFVEYLSIYIKKCILSIWQTFTWASNIIFLSFICSYLVFLHLLPLLVQNQMKWKKISLNFLFTSSTHYYKSTLRKSLFHHNLLNRHFFFFEIH